MSIDIMLFVYLKNCSDFLPPGVDYESERYCDLFYVHKEGDRRQTGVGRTRVHGHLFSWVEPAPDGSFSKRGVYVYTELQHTQIRYRISDHKCKKHICNKL